MPRPPRLATRAVEEALDVQVALRDLKTVIINALADGNVTQPEAHELLVALRKVELESIEAANIAEQVDISELLAIAHMSGEHSPRLLSRAEAVGLPIVMLSPNLPRRHDDDDDEPLRAA